MSIDSIATGYGLISGKKETPRLSSIGSGFGEFLTRAGESDPVSAATAAEILRLKMLDSAVNVGGTEETPSTGRSATLQRLLERFLEQLPQGSGSAASSGVGNAAEMEGGDHPVAPASFVTEGGAPFSGDASARSLVDRAATRYGVDSGLIRAIIKAESGFDPRAVSSAGAQGLMQLMPGTAKVLGVTDAFDPEQNVMAGTRFLKDLLRRYQGNLDEALAAYNWGPGNVDRHGIDHLPRETRAYLAKVKGYLAQQAG
jgi:hypothetical protein